MPANSHALLSPRTQDKKIHACDLQKFGRYTNTSHAPFENENCATHISGKNIHCNKFDFRLTPQWSETMVFNNFTMVQTGINNSGHSCGCK